MEESAKHLIAQSLAARGGDRLPYYATSANGQVIALAASDGVFKEMLLQADEIHADGMPLVILSRHFAKNALRERVATTDLVHVVAEKAGAVGLSFYFLGGTEEANGKAVARMRERYPKLAVVGRHHGYFPRTEEKAIVEEIARLKPDILWVGLGVPLEQQFVSRNLGNLHGVGVIKTAGGLFDFVSGTRRRAPIWMQKMGMEWLYRTYLEPRRLLSRYLKTNPIALWRIIFHSK